MAATAAQRGLDSPAVPSDPAGKKPLLGNKLQGLSGGVSPKRGQNLLELERTCLLGVGSTRVRGH